MGPHPGAAEAVGLQVSEYVVRRCLGPQESTRSMEFGLTPSVLRRMVLAVLVLEELEERRVKNQGAEELWRKVVAKVDAWIDGQDELG